MEEMQKHNGVALAAMRAGMDRKTARKYARLGKLPSELKQPHIWRTREDPFADDWPALAAMLADAPELEGSRRPICSTAPGRSRNWTGRGTSWRGSSMRATGTRRAC
jgi:hypothetical protein